VTLIGWRYENAAIIVINTGNVVAKSAKRMITASRMPPYKAATEPMTMPMPAAISAPNNAETSL
jgi:hypothetical protein